MKYIKLNNIDLGNIRIDVFIDTKTNTIVLTSKQIPHKYPTENEYLYGVKTCTTKYTRENPNEKIWNNSLRQKVDEIIQQNNVYEVIYINDNNSLTEGSRSNIFFIDDNKLYSAPFSQVLPGITRKYIIETAKHINIKFIEQEINIDEIINFNSCFIAGTSPKILPINMIDNIEFNTKNTTLRKIMLGFEKVIEQDIENFKW